MATAKELIAGAKRSERSVPVCMRGDLTEQMLRLGRELDEAQKAAASSAGSLASGGEARRLAEQIDALREEMLEHSITFVLRAVTRRRWTELVAAHKPREGNKSDEALSINEDSFFAELLPECTVEPVLDADDWKALLTEVLSEATWQMLTNNAWAVNCRDVDVPFFPAVSRILSNSEPE